MEVFSWLPRFGRAHARVDVFENLSKSDRDLLTLLSVSARADTEVRVPPGDKPRTVAAWTRGFALLGVIFVTGSAAIWAKDISLQPPSATVTLPPARLAFHTSATPHAARDIAVTTAHIEPAGGTVRQPTQKSSASTFTAVPVTLHASVAPRVAPPNIPNATATERLVAILARWEDLSSDGRKPADAIAALPKVSPPKASRYTSLEPPACTLLHDANLPLRRCPGVAGYALEAADARPAGYVAVLGPGGQRSELELSRIAPGGSLGKLAEWRSQGDGEPRALIVRVSLPGKRAVSSLIVAKLDSTPCVVAVVPRGPRQNERARSVADREQLKCATDATAAG